MHSTASQGVRLQAIWRCERCGNWKRRNPHEAVLRAPRCGPCGRDGIAAHAGPAMAAAMRLRPEVE